jgi:FkbM family methyltransferase
MEGEVMDKRALYAWLNRPARRWLLTLLGTAYASARRRQWCRVSYDAGMFVHRFAGRTIVRPFLGGAGPAEVDAEVADVFFYRYVPRAGDTVLDVGSGIGEEVALFSERVGRGGRLICIEAHPTAHRCLAKFVELNDPPAVLHLQLAAGERPGIVRIANDEGDHSIRSSVSEGAESSVPVPMLPLDDIVRGLHLPVIDLLKMNIEGSEVAALKGMSQTLDRVRHAVICCHDFLAPEHGQQMRTKEAVRTILLEAGLSVVDRADPRPWVGDILYASRDAGSA